MSSFPGAWNISTIEEIEQTTNPDYEDLKIVGYNSNAKFIVFVSHVDTPPQGRCHEGSFNVRVNENHYIEISVEKTDLEEKEVPKFEPFKLSGVYHKYMPSVVYMLLHGIAAEL